MELVKCSPPRNLFTSEIVPYMKTGVFAWPQALAPNLYLPVLAPNLHSPVLTSNLYLLVLTSNLYLPALAPNLDLLALAPNLYYRPWFPICIY